jgi:hypothetical protein
MFRTFVTRFETDVEALKRAIDVHEYARASYYETPIKELPGPCTWTPTISRDPGKLEWQIYDFCAAITRTYVLFSVFVEDLAAAYLELLPTLYDDYRVLPLGVQKQHRVGSAQILLKLGENGPYESVREGDLLSTVADAVSGKTPYSLYPTAFFVESHRQNYRLEALARLFQALGVDNLNSKLTNHPHIRRYIRDVRNDSATVESELKNLIDLRNAAAHSDVSDVEAAEELHRIADFVMALGRALADILSAEANYRKYKLGHLGKLGSVTELHHGGFVVVLSANPVPVAEGDDVAIIGGSAATMARVEEIRRDNVQVAAALPTAGEEIGVRLSRRSRLGDVIAVAPQSAQSLSRR